MLELSWKLALSKLAEVGCSVLLNRAAVRRGHGFTVVCWMEGSHDGQFYEKKVIVMKSVS